MVFYNITDDVILPPQHDDVVPSFFKDLRSCYSSLKIMEQIYLSPSGTLPLSLSLSPVLIAMQIDTEYNNNELSQAETPTI